MSHATRRGVEPSIMVSSVMVSSTIAAGRMRSLSLALHFIITSAAPDIDVMKPCRQSRSH